MAETTTPLISARGISKHFASIEVLRDVDLDLERGEIHALLGENGAGKSTFAKILAGVHRPSRGTLTLNGQPVEIPNPIVAQKLGITLIHQEPISFPDLSVAENLVIGAAEHGWLSRVPWAQMTREARRLMDLLGVRIDVNRPMRGLSIADQQMVEIARALASDSRLIIMDEPTAPLTPKEVETLFAIARRLRDEGRTISSSRTGSKRCALFATASPSSATAARSPPTPSASSAIPTSFA
jgi:rhamnose transport system ATP-binding protein